LGCLGTFRRPRFGRIHQGIEASSVNHFPFEQHLRKRVEPPIAPVSIAMVGIFARMLLR